MSECVEGESSRIVARRMACKQITCWTVEGTGAQEAFQKVGMVVKHREVSKLFEAPEGLAEFELYLEKQL